MSTFSLKYNKVVSVYVVQWMCIFGSHPLKICEHGTHQVQYEDFASAIVHRFLFILITGTSRLRNRILLALSRKYEIVWNVHAIGYRRGIKISRISVAPIDSRWK